MLNVVSMNKNRGETAPKKTAAKAKPEAGKPPRAAAQNRLYRSENNRIFGGVAGGLGEYLDIDPVIIRIIFIILALNGVGVLLYLVLWAIIPTKSKANGASEEIFQENVAEMKVKAKSFVGELRTASGRESARTWLGISLIIFGGLLFLENLGIFDFLRFWRIWPLLLVALGLALLAKKNQE